MLSKGKSYGNIVIKKFNYTNLIPECQLAMEV